MQWVLNKKMVSKMGYFVPCLTSFKGDGVSVEEAKISLVIWKNSFFGKTRFGIGRCIKVLNRTIQLSLTYEIQDWLPIIGIWLLYVIIHLLGTTYYRYWEGLIHNSINISRKGHSFKPVGINSFLLTINRNNSLVMIVG